MKIISYRAQQSTLASYAIKMTNQSQSGEVKYFVVYQIWPTAPANDYVVAWLASPAAQNTSIYFEWDLTVSFAWAKTGALRIGTMASVGQECVAELTQNNQITLTRLPQGAYQFAEQMTQTAPQFTVVGDSNLPADEVAVGMSMGSNGALASQIVQAQASSTYSFIPSATPEYLVGFSISSIATGQVFDPHGLSQVARIQFPENMSGADAVLQADNTWTITYTA